VPFIYGVLNQRRATSIFSGREQLSLGERILTLVEQEIDKDSVTPLLITLFIEAAIKINAEGFDLASLPNSIPETYISYVQSFETDPGAQRGVRPSLLVEASVILGPVALSDLFTPSEFNRNTALAMLKVIPGDTAETLLEKLRLAGVLSSRQLAGRIYYKFAFDPVAEYMAAICTLRHCADDAGFWINHVRQVTAARSYPDGMSGYLSAIDNCLSAYQEALGLKKLHLPWKKLELSEINA
jgi:hypothetical protein